LMGKNGYESMLMQSGPASAFSFHRITFPRLWEQPLNDASAVEQESGHQGGVKESIQHSQQILLAKNRSPQHKNT